MTNEPSPRPWRLEDSDTIRDAAGVVVVSALNPCDRATRRLIVDAVNHIEETKRLSIKLYDPIRRAEDERDRLRDFARRMAALVVRYEDDHGAYSDAYDEIAEAHAAIGEGTK